MRLQSRSGAKRGSIRMVRRDKPNCANLVAADRPLERKFGRNWGYRLDPTSGCPLADPRIDILYGPTVRDAQMTPNQPPPRIAKHTEALQFKRRRHAALRARIPHGIPRQPHRAQGGSGPKVRPAPHRC